MKINDSEFEGRVVMVTGAAGGIGQAMAEAFCARGATVVLTDRSEAVHETAGKLGPRHRAFVMDVCDEAGIAATVRAAEETLGRIDALVNNAGIGILAPAESLTTEVWDRHMDVNLKGAFLVARAVAAGMLARGYGRIVNIASQAAVIGIEGHVAYCASKAGLLGMTRCMALEWAPRGVTVNAISPTVVETDLALVGWAGEKGERARASIPTRRFAQPWEIAAAACFLAGEGAAMINGENMLVDGGYTVI